MVWSSLKQHGTNRWVRSAYFWLFFVPVAAKILSTVPETVAIDFGGRHFDITMALPFSWKMFYFGAVCFSLANFLYYVACPPLIRDYDTYSEYEDAGKGAHYVLHQFFSLIWEKQKLRGKNQFYIHRDRIKEFTGRFTNGTFWEVIPFVGLEVTKLLEDESIHPVAGVGKLPRDQGLLTIRKESIPEAFWFARNFSEKHRDVFRTVCTVLFVCGYAAFLIVAYQGFQYVLFAA